MNFKNKLTQLDTTCKRFTLDSLNLKLFEKKRWKSLLCTHPSKRTELTVSISNKTEVTLKAVTRDKKDTIY